MLVERLGEGKESTCEGQVTAGATSPMAAANITATATAMAAAHCFMIAMGNTTAAAAAAEDKCHNGKCHCLKRKSVRHFPRQSPDICLTNSKSKRRFDRF